MAEKAISDPKPNKVYIIKIPSEGMRNIEKTEAVN